MRLFNLLGAMLAPGIEIPDWNENDIPSTLYDGINNVLKMISLIGAVLLALIGTVAVILIIIAAFKYKTAKSPDEAAGAIEKLKRVIIGIVIAFGAVLLVSIITAVVPTFL